MPKSKTTKTSRASGAKKSSSAEKTDQISIRLTRSTMDRLDEIHLELKKRHRDTHPRGVALWKIIEVLLADSLELEHVEQLLIESGELPE